MMEQPTFIIIDPILLTGFTRKPTTNNRGKEGE